MKDINWKIAFPGRLKKRMKELHLTGKALAKRCSLSNGSLISLFIHGERVPTHRMLELLEKSLDVPSGWFQFPEKIINLGKDRPSNNGFSQVTSLPILKNYESYNWVKYGKLPEICNYRQAIMDDNITARSFILEIEGDSMTSERTPSTSLAAGDMVVVNPDIAPEIGDLVVIKKGDDVKVREYQKDGMQIIFKALDARYPLLPFDDNTEILGVLVDRITRLRKTPAINANP